MPPTGTSLGEDVDATHSFILIEYDQNPRVLRGCYEGLKFPRKSVNFLDTGESCSRSLGETLPQRRLACASAPWMVHAILRAILVGAGY